MTVVINGSTGIDTVQDGVVTDTKLNLTANSAEIKEALNASNGAPIYACRAWVNFNGTGTVAIRASGNVSSITDINTGYFRVNFTTAMPDDKYSVNNTCDDGAYGAICATATLRQNVAPTTTYVDVSTSNTSLGRTSADFLYNSVAIFR